MKKVLALVITVMTIMTLSIGVFAASEYSITVNNTAENVSIVGNDYSAYKLFNVVYNDDKTAFNYSVTDSFKDFSYNGKSGSELVDYVGTLASNSDEIDAFAEAVYSYINENSIAAAGSVKATGERDNVIELSSAGYYLVYGTATADGKTVTAACALTTTKPTATVNVKADAPKLDKTIVNADDGKGNATAQDVGSIVEFKLTSKVPVMTGYDTYKFIVHDTMTSGLTFNADSVKVTIGGQDATGYTVKTTDIGSETFQIVFADLKGATEGAEIVITYSATVNDAALRTDSESNTAKLEYSNNPYDENSTTTTPDDVVYVFDFSINIDKYAKGDSTKKLKGAQFVLYKESEGAKLYYVWNETDKKAEWTSDKDAATVVTTDENGKGRFNGVDSGTYKLEELAAPAGYNKLDGDVTVEITATYNEDGTLASSNTTIDGDGQYTLTAAVENSAGTELPTTGGIGTTVFYIAGGILVAAAIIILIARKKASAK